MTLYFKVSSKTYTLTYTFNPDLKPDFDDYPNGSSPHQWACVAGYKPGENEDDPCQVDDDVQVRHVFGVQREMLW